MRLYLISTLGGQMRSHLDTSWKTNAPLPLPLAWPLWHLVTKNKHAPHMCNLRTTRYHNISHHQQRQCSPRYFPEPGLPLYLAYTWPAAICTWNPLSEIMWNWRQFGSESSNMLKHANEVDEFPRKFDQKNVWSTAWRLLETWSI